MDKKIALVTGANGQDGANLCELLLSNNYLVKGIVRRSSTDTSERVKHLLKNYNLSFITCDICDYSGMNRIISHVKPDLFFNTAAQSHVGVSFDEPLATFDTDAKAVINMLESIKNHSPNTRFLQCSTSELYGDTKETPQDENTKFHPESPYAIAKLAAHQSVDIYRRGYNLFACSSICFNHGGPTRGENFVERKVTKYVGEVYKYYKRFGVLPNPDQGEIPYLRLGNLNAKRDWSHSKDIVKGMLLMLQQDQPKDYVLASGETHTIEELLKYAFGVIGVVDYMRFVKIDPEFYRPVDVNLLCGDPSMAQKELKWSPEYNFQKLIEEMVHYDCVNHYA